MRRKLAITIAAAVTLGTGSLFCAPLHAKAGVTVPPSPIIVTVGGLPATPDTTVYTLSLSASPTHAVSGDWVVVTASLSPSLPPGYHIDIWETDTATLSRTGNSCDFNPCDWWVTHDTGQFSYHAFADSESNPSDPPVTTSVIATAAPAVATWSIPSSAFCDPATLPILDGQLAGLNLLLAATTGGPQSAVCFRVDNGGGVAVGGAVLVNAGLAPTTPSVSTGNLCTGAPGNTVAGPHPLLDLSVLGQPVFLDAYSGPASNGALWVCASLEGVADTVSLPLSLGTVPSVTFVPDPDSLVP